MAERSPDERRLHGPKAMVLHGAALAIDETNHRAANELGVLMASYGQLDEAKRLFVLSATLAPVPETWHNLAVVHERLHEDDLAGKARYEWELAHRQRGTNPAAARTRINVEWVDARQFAASSAEDAPRSAARQKPNRQ
jgi:hypothetical protein